MKHRTIRRSNLAIPSVVLPWVVWASLLSPAKAADVPSDPALRAQITKYLEQARYAQPQISPDGRHLAVLSPVGHRQNLVVIDLETRQPVRLTTLTDYDVTEVRWIGSDYLSFSLGDLKAPGSAEFHDGGGVFVVHRSGGTVREFQPTVRAFFNSDQVSYPEFSILSTMGPDSNEFIASSNERSSEHSDLYRVNAATGRKTLLTFDRPGDVQQWILDSRREIRGAVIRRAKAAKSSQAEDDEDGKAFDRILVWRDRVGGPWREVADLGLQSGAIRPIAPDGEDKLWVVTSKGRDTSALYKLDLKTGALDSTPFVDNPRFDIHQDAARGRVPGLLLHPVTNKPFAVAINGDVPELYYLDDDLDTLHRGLQATFPGQQVSLQPTTGSRVLVSVSSDVKPQQVYFYDQQTKKLTRELNTRPDIKDGDLQPLRPFLLKTRDGLEIPGYYVLPKGHQAGQRVPTLIHIHGGPQVRADSHGPLSSSGVIEAQVLASQGFAVVLPNFRITPGLGKRVYFSGFGTLGRKMSEDHEDALKWAVEAGFADPKRVCIGGSSYGGYATLRALTKTPDLFACGVAGLVVSDLQLQLTSSRTDFAGSKSAVAHWRSLIGEKGSGWEQSKAVSPAFQLDRLKAPLMIWAGGSDRRTPIEQYHKVVDGMRALGKAPDVTMVKPEEAHGYYQLQNEVDLYEQMVMFLRRHVGTPKEAAPAAAPAAAASGPAR